MRLMPRNTLLFVTTIMFTMSGCRFNTRAELTLATPELDTNRLAQIDSVLHQSYDTMLAQYEAMADQMTPEEQQLYLETQLMHNQTVQAQQQMMSDWQRCGMMHRERSEREQGRWRRGMMDGCDVEPWDFSDMRERRQQMFSMHEAMAQMHQEARRSDMANRHRQMAQWHRQMMEGLPSPPADAEMLTPREGETTSGQALYAQNCASCHGSMGTGMMGVFPPLAGADYVTGKEQLPLKILLNGLQGPIEVAGQTYNGVMPSFKARLSDTEIAAIVTYIRSSWGNDASAVSADDVAVVRRQYQGRTQPLSPAEL